ncbi:uncharacterized protein ACO6RY_08379 [Pungitius sinensis]
MKLSAPCATMSALLKKRWPDMDSSRGYGDFINGTRRQTNPHRFTPVNGPCTREGSSQEIGPDLFLKDHLPHMPYVTPPPLSTQASPSATNTFVFRLLCILLLK